MPTVETKKRIHRSLRGLRILAKNRRAEPAGGQAVQTADPSRTGGEGLKTSEAVLGSLSLDPDVPVSCFKADGSGTTIP